MRRSSSQKPLRRRRDLGDEIANERLDGERCQRHLARLEPRRARLDGGAVELDHAFLAGILADAGEADGERRIAVGPDSAQSVEHRLDWLEPTDVALPPPCVGAFAAPDFLMRDVAHCAAAGVAVGTTVSAMLLGPSRATWLTRHCGSMPGKSSRWWAP